MGKITVMHDFASLVADHERLSMLSDKLLLVTASRRPDGLGAYLALRALSCELDAHLAAEDAAIYGNALRASGTGHSIQHFEAEFAALKAEWGIYLREWTVENIEADWQNFIEATAWMMEHLKARIDAENSLILPQALSDGTLRLKAA
jgi:hypothetical protein